MTVAKKQFVYLLYVATLYWQLLSAACLRAHVLVLKVVGESSFALTLKS